MSGYFVDNGIPTTTTTTTTTTSRSLSSSTSSNTIRARTREDDSVRYLCDYFARSFGRVCPPVIERDIGDWLAQGIDGEVVEGAIDEAQLAPRPSWAYVRAIMRRVMLSGF